MSPVSSGDQGDPDQGTAFSRGRKRFTLEAMKMETMLSAEKAGVVPEVLVIAGTQVDTGELLLRFKG